MVNKKTDKSMEGEKGSSPVETRSETHTLIKDIDAEMAKKLADLENIV